jgi:hypothetical protein
MQGRPEEADVPLLDQGTTLDMISIDSKRVESPDLSTKATLQAAVRST